MSDNLTAAYPFDLSGLKPGALAGQPNLAFHLKWSPYSSAI
jgi:hypothetical protein